MTLPADTRKWLIGGAMALAAVVVIGGILTITTSDYRENKKIMADHAKRREELWSLLGPLPRDHQPKPPKVIKSEHHPAPNGEGYTLETLELDLNGIEPVPAILVIPDVREKKAPGMLYIHWHGGQYQHGKNELTDERPDRLGPYAPVLAKKGIVTLAIDSWCFGERNHGVVDRQIEWDTFKKMLWKGQVLWGMMMWDEHQALSYLASRPEVDPNRLGVMGMSMGATKAWWLAALDPRVKCCIDICCLTDYDELLRINNVKGHGIYYYVPDLLNHFSASQINELIAPRSHLSVNGREDTLTPPVGVEKIRDHLLPIYRQLGKEEDCRIELYDVGHVETPQMRKLIEEWLDQKLVGNAS